MLVVDASVLVVALADDHVPGDAAREALQGERLAAPELIDLEVVSVLRRHVMSGGVDVHRAQLALSDLNDLPLIRAAHAPLLRRCWDLRDNLTPYDAAYVALAEALDAPLITADRRLATAPGLRCRVTLVS